MHSKKYTKTWKKWIFEKRVFAFEFFSGTSGFWISLKLGSFTSEQVPVKHTQNLESTGAVVAEIWVGSTQ